MRIQELEVERTFIGFKRDFGDVETAAHISVLNNVLPNIYASCLGNTWTQVLINERDFDNG